MKYLKLFESLIKHSDPKAINNPLSDFSKRLEDIVIGLKQIDNYKNSKVRRYYRENGDIFITYTPKIHKTLKIVLKNNSDNVSLTVGNFRLNFLNNKDEIKNSKELYDFIDSQLKEYKENWTEYSYSPPGADVSYYNFHISEIDNVIKELEEYYAYVDASKYNL